MLLRRQSKWPIFVSNRLGMFRLRPKNPFCFCIRYTKIPFAIECPPLAIRPRWKWNKIRQFIAENIVNNNFYVCCIELTFAVACPNEYIYHIYIYINSPSALREKCIECVRMSPRLISLLRPLCLSYQILLSNGNSVQFRQCFFSVNRITKLVIKC